MGILWKPCVAIIGKSTPQHNLINFISIWAYVIDRPFITHFSKIVYLRERELNNNKDGEMHTVYQEVANRLLS